MVFSNALDAARETETTLAQIGAIEQMIGSSAVRRARESNPSG